MHAIKKMKAKKRQLLCHNEAVTRTRKKYALMLEGYHKPSGKKITITAVINPKMAYKWKKDQTTLAHK